ncbi:MAG: tetratricopeptide repeat protein, partial [Candidatus Cloacimonadaceae bacterium]|nr:tetratricopeptide repeat protein [Candidatus Cloacimonadaceae bacterium]
LAEFYIKTGRLPRAEDLLTRLGKEHPGDAEITLKRAELLISRRNEAEARVLLSQISSPLEQKNRAQALIRQIDGAKPDPSALIEDVADSLATGFEISEPEEPLTMDARPVPMPKRDWKQALQRTPLYIAIPIALILLLLLGRLLRVGAILQRLLSLPSSFKSKKRVDTTDGEDGAQETGDSYLEDGTMRRLVGRLSQDGWGEAEIAAELKIPRKAVHKILQNQVPLVDSEPTEPGEEEIKS